MKQNNNFHEKGQKKQDLFLNIGKNSQTNTPRQISNHTQENIFENKNQNFFNQQKFHITPSNNHPVQNIQGNKLYVSYETFQDFVQQLEKRFQRVEERIEGNEQLIQLSDKMFEMKRTDENGKNNNSISFHQDLLQEINNKIEKFEKKFNGLEDQFKKNILKIEQFQKQVGQQFDQFLKNAKEKFDEFYDKEEKMKNFTLKYSESVNILAQQLTLSKEEYHLTKNDLIDNFKDLTLKFKDIEKISLDNHLEIKNLKPVINSIEDDLLQILKDHKDLTLKFQQTQFVEDDLNYIKEQFSQIYSNQR